MPIKAIMTSQELDQHSKIPMTKANGYILLEKVPKTEKWLSLQL